MTARERAEAEARCRDLGIRVGASRAAVRRELLARGGDPAARVVDDLIGRAADENPARRAAVAGNVTRVRADLEGPDSTPAERLLAERAAVCWLASYEAGLVSQAVDGATDAGVAEFHQKRRDREHRRFQSAVKALAVLRRLAVPAGRSEIDSGGGPAGVVRAGRERGRRHGHDPFPETAVMPPAPFQGHEAGPHQRRFLRRARGFSERDNAIVAQDAPCRPSNDPTLRRAECRLRRPESAHRPPRRQRPQRPSAGLLGDSDELRARHLNVSRTGLPSRPVASGSGHSNIWFGPGLPAAGGFRSGSSRTTGPHRRRRPLPTTESRRRSWAQS